MARITCTLWGDDGGDRGQMLVFTGFLIAFTILGISIMTAAGVETSTNVHGEPVSDVTRGDVLKDAVRVNIRDVIRVENTAMESDVASDVNNAVDSIATTYEQRYADRGVVVEITRGTTTTGERVAWDTPGSDFTNETGAGDWVVSTGINDVRQFDVTVQTASLPATTPTQRNVESTAPGFKTRRAGVNVTRYVYVNSNTGDVTVTTVTEGTGVTETCSVGAVQNNAISGDVTVSVTTGDVVSGGFATTCGDGVTRNAVTGVEVVNGDAATGSFEYVTSNTPSTTTDSNLTTAAAVYSVEMTYTYDTAKTTYETTRTITPGGVTA